MSSALAPPRGSEMQEAPAAATHRPARPTVRRSWWPDVIGSLTVLSLVVVAALWILGGGLTGVDSFATAMTSLGRITGLLASDLLLIQVLLMAR
ncbi:MAG TPA: hypothetical protein VHM65_09640, partial [Candidatus Lustribacter sp.]|nr:hypothetical protein [Candidatus Lustribacter sp.]